MPSAHPLTSVHIRPSTHPPTHLPFMYSTFHPPGFSKAAQHPHHSPGIEHPSGANSAGDISPNPASSVMRHSGGDTRHHTGNWNICFFDLYSCFHFSKTGPYAAAHTGLEHQHPIYVSLLRAGIRGMFAHVLLGAGDGTGVFNVLWATELQLSSLGFKR